MYDDAQNNTTFGQKMILNHPETFQFFVDRAKMTESETKMTLQRVQHVYYAMKQADSLQLSGSEVRQHST